MEQKNSTLVRAYVGYQRLETPGQWVALNALYAGTNPGQLREEIYQAVERLGQNPLSPITTNQTTN